ncbi:MAG TPA: DUF4231 domain-containing protein [Streptosporangiaceae bacterium]|nr:DUF4231 domain-containing protein [Streptosporangiaceae bacterium]
MTTPARPIAEYAWERQSVWSQTADRLKGASQLRWRSRMILTVAAAALALAGSQLKPVSAAASTGLTAAAAVALAGVGLLRVQQDVEQTRRWTRARSVSEAMKADVYTFLAESGEGRPEDLAQRLAAQVQRLEDEAEDLQPYTQDVTASARPLPQVTDVDSYLEVRVRRSQLENYYGPKSRRLHTRLRQAKAAEVTLTLMAAALAAVASVSANAAAWAAVVTTAVAAITAYTAAERYEFLWIEYTRTAAELRRLLDRRTAADGHPLTGMKLVAECEHVISVQNEAWMAKWGKKAR